MTDWAEEEPTPALVRATITTAEVAELYGFEISSSGKIPSLSNPDERTPSLHVYADDGGWFDFSAGKGGDVIDFVMAVEGCTFGQAMWRLWKKALKAGREPGDVEKQPVKAIVDFTDALERDNHVDSLLSSPWTHLHPPTNCRQHGSDLLIPHEDSEGVYGVKVRGLDGSKSAWPGSAFSKRLYCMHGWTRPTAESAIVVEGETDAWSLQAVLPDVWILALPSGAGTFRRHWLNELPADVTLIFDNDKSGKDARDKWDRETGWQLRHLFVPQLANDIRETLTKWPDWRP